MSSRWVVMMKLQHKFSWDLITTICWGWKKLGNSSGAARYGGLLHFWECSITTVFIEIWKWWFFASAVGAWVVLSYLSNSKMFNKGMWTHDNNGSISTNWHLSSASWLSKRFKCQGINGSAFLRQFGLHGQFLSNVNRSQRIKRQQSHL